nr:transposase [Streptomyces agglomeratus]
MTRRLPCPPAPGPLEAYAARFDDLLSTLAQRRGFREYLAGLLLPRDRNKTLTCLAGAEPVAGAQHPAVQRLQFFLSESTWDHEQINARRLELLLADPAAEPHAGGVLVIDDSGDRKDGTATAHVGRQWLGRLGKTDNGIVTVTTCWADESVYYPLHAVPYSPARHFPAGKSDPGFRTKLQEGAPATGLLRCLCRLQLLALALAVARGRRPPGACSGGAYALERRPNLNVVLPLGVGSAAVAPPTR